SFYSALTISTLCVLSIHDRLLAKNPVSRIVSFFLNLALQGENTISQSTQPISGIPEVNFCDILPCDTVYCCPIHQLENRSTSETIKKKTLFLIFLGIDTTASSIHILETQQSIDSRYCSKNLQCRLYDSAYYFRVAAPDFADCSTDPHYAGMFFTDYYFYFYRQCK
uniref:Myelin gene regulatory factor C-terminal domain-containing protein n=1 Tax=Dromaius novaehollandiae TaxID=8790 RepID=A0A8C4K6W5_DRONO